MLRIAISALSTYLDGFIDARHYSAAALYTDLDVWRNTQLGRESIRLERLKVVELPGERTNLRF